MKHVFKLFLAHVLVLLSLNAHADTKIGFVEIQRVLKDAPQTTEIGKRLEKEFSGRTDELIRMQNQLKQLTSGSSTNKEQEIETLSREFERKKQELDEEVNLRRSQELATLQELISKTVSSVSVAEGCDLVIFNGLAYGNKKLDLTDKVIQALAKQGSAP